MIAEPIKARLGRRAMAAAVTTAALLLSGCAAGQIAQTARQTPAIEGVNATVGSIALRVVTVASPTDKSWPKGTDAPLQMIIANSALAADTLTSVTSEAAQSVQVSAASVSSSGSAATSSGLSATSSAVSSPAGSGSAGSGSASVPLPIPGQKSVSIGYDPGNASITLRGLTRELFPAQTVNVTFSFETAGSVTFPVSVNLTDPPSNRPSLNVAPTAE